VFLFVVDLCTVEEELAQAKRSIREAVEQLPEDAYVGLITFGKNVHVHELGFTAFPKCRVFRGEMKEENVKVERFIDLLGLGPNKAGEVSYLVPVTQGKLALAGILEDLHIDPWPVASAERPLRCTGVALAVGIALLEATCKSLNARLMLFAAGPPSIGPGKVVGTKLEETIRSHHDLHKGNAPHFNKAVKFYEAIGVRAQANGHVIDIFACSLDQIGLAEMKVLVEKTGGLFVLSDSFESKQFVDSFKHVFRRAEDGYLAMSFNAELEVLTTREFKVNGCIGTVSSKKNKTSYVGDKEIGVGNTSSWSIGGIDPSTTVALYFDVVNQQASKVAENSFGYLQILTSYKHSSGSTRLKVTTAYIPFVDAAKPEGLNQIRAGFDQEAATALMARYAVFKAETEFAVDVLRWLDRMLIRLVAKFGDYTKERPESFQLSQEFAFYPQFMFHLRRSPFLQVFNASPDETAFYRIIICRESVTNTLVMIQPTLMAYSLEGPPTPVLLDAQSTNPEHVLLLDAFFHVVVWVGGNLAQWRKDRLHETPEYAYLANLYSDPEHDAQALVQSRFPVPLYVRCEQNDSQSRFLNAKLNPSVTHTSQKGPAGGPSSAILTDDVSLNVFMEHLRKLAVQP
jgi:protein transport protein SEC23